MLVKCPTTIPSIITTLSLSLPHVTPKCLSVCFLQKIFEKSFPPPSFCFWIKKTTQRNEVGSLILGQNLRKPYLHFCQQLAERLRAQPEVKDSSAMVDLRRFCGGQNRGFGRLEKMGKKGPKRRLLVCCVNCYVGKF